MDSEKNQEILASLISEGEKEQAVQLLCKWSEEAGFKDVIFNVLEPVLVKWGKLWMKGELSLAHGYISGKVAEEFYLLASKDPDFSGSSIKKKGTVILGNVEDDFHPLGRRLVGIYAQAAGWNIVDLGTDVLPEFFVSEAIAHHADIIAVSAMMFTTARNILKVRQNLDQYDPNGNIKLAVGGAIFKLRPEMVAEVGGDGTADNAILAPDLFDYLIGLKNNQSQN